MRRIVIVSLIVLAVLSACQKEETAKSVAPQSATTSEISTLKEMNVILAGALEPETPANQAETFVVMQVVGTAALVQDETVTNSTPMTLVLPKVPAHSETEPEHQAYVAWHPPQQVGLGRDDFGQRETENGDPAPWRFFVLNREEIVVRNDLGELEVNKPIQVTRGDTCDRFNPDFACVPRARDFLPAGVNVRLNSRLLQPTKPLESVQARMDIKRGITLLPEVRDNCEWEFRTGNNLTEGTDVVKKQHAAGLVLYIFKIKGTTLTLGTRDLDQENAAVTDLLTVQATKKEPVIYVRIGNSPGVFPDPSNVRPVDPDHHYGTYYDFLVDPNGDPVNPDSRLLPFRVRSCSALHKPTITCGPGWI